MIIAEIALRTKSTYVDQLYSYVIPQELYEKADIGYKVIVPFGKGNKPMEGIIFKIIKENENAEDFSRKLEKKNLSKNKLKEIIEVAGEFPILKKAHVDLCMWMQNRYLCTLSDAINLIYPKGMKFSVNRKVLPGEKFSADFLFDEKDEEINIIYRELFSKGEYVFKDEVSEKMIRSLYRLQNEKIINLSWTYNHKVNEVTYRVLKLSETFRKDNRRGLINLNKFGKAQRRIIDFMLINNEVVDRDLKELVNVAESSVKSLIDRKILESEEKDYYRGFSENDEEGIFNIKLTDEQTGAVQKINLSRKVSLLHGVTGSGKTEVYITLLKKILSEGKSGIILVPEIGLTPQTVHRFKRVFGSDVIVYHSKLSEGERHDAFRLCQNGRARVVIGTRSALFLPMKNLGLIVLDECHDSSYKSELNPKYVSEEVALYLNIKYGIKVVLGSATPTTEQYYRAVSGEYTLVNLRKRANKKPMPEIQVVDMKREIKMGNITSISGVLNEKMKHHLENGNQIILFINRRGFSNFIYCKSCGHVLKCDRCDISMTYHKYDNRMRCHYCDNEKELINRCPNCNEEELALSGSGTQKIEDELKELFPEYNIERYDRDSVSRKGEADRILKDFEKGRIDILIGTQMLSKGLDFKNVTLAAILSGDMMLNYPDYKSAENTFSLITQVAGRAGRAEKQGEVILQAVQSDHYAIEYAVKYDYEGFYRQEIELRRMFRYPPFNNVMRLLFTGEDFNKVKKNAFRVKDIMMYLLRQNGVEDLNFIYGPGPCGIERINSKYRWQIMFRDTYVDFKVLKGLIKYICLTKKKETLINGVNISIDINPDNIL